MDEQRDKSQRPFGRRSFLTLAGASAVTALAGAAGTTTAVSTAETTNQESDQPTDGPLSPPPTPPRSDVPRPSGDPGGLSVLDWAGFESAVSYTFDDGQPSHIEHYGELQATGAPMTFYTSTNVDFDGYDEGWRQVAADGHEIGNHTVSHPFADLTGSSFGEPLESTAEEIRRCTEYIVERFGQSGVWTMAAPYGDTGWSDPAERAEVFLNRGVGGGTVSPNDDTDPYNLPCYMATAGETAETFDGLVDDSRSDGDWLIFLFHSITPTNAEWYAPVDVDEITGNIEHATGYDDVWVDTVANIGAYWRAQRLFESVTPEVSEDETEWKWSLPDDFPEGQTLRVTVDGGTLHQNGEPLEWNSHGFYEVSLDAESLLLTP